MKYLSPFIYLYGVGVMAKKPSLLTQEYRYQRKLLRDYLSRQRRAGYVIKTKLPKIAKMPDYKSIEKLQRLREEAKQERSQIKQNISDKRKELDRLGDVFAKEPMRDVRYNVLVNKQKLLVDMETGEIIGYAPSNKPIDNIDSYDIIIQNTVYDWTRNGTQTDYTERIEYFIERCVDEYGTEKVGRALQEAVNNGMSLTRMERYNNDYCHDWIAEIEEILSNIPVQKAGRTVTVPFSEEMRKEFEGYFMDANEDNFNSALDSEVYESRYGGFNKFKRTGNMVKNFGE